MNWLTEFIRPKIRSIVSKQDIPDHLWDKCPGCDAMLFHRDLEENLNVCYQCGYHMKVSLERRLELLFDGGKYKTHDLPKVPHDPLKFRDKKKYADRLRDHQHKTGHKDALIIAQGTIGGQRAVVAAMNFEFMGGSMGAAVGSGILKASNLAVEHKAAFITIPSSGGARMQEGAISLMQMPRTVLAVKLVKDAGLPYIVLLTNPTTGGVSASFAMTGDVHIAEPGATIGFAGKRVIQETIREELPEDFQTSEYLLEHGMVDIVAPRKELPIQIGRILNLLMDKKKTDGNRGGGNGKKHSSAKENAQRKGAGKTSRQEVKGKSFSRKLTGSSLAYDEKTSLSGRPVSRQPAGRKGKYSHSSILRKESNLSQVTGKIAVSLNHANNNFLSGTIPFKIKTEVSGSTSRKEESPAGTAATGALVQPVTRRVARACAKSAAAPAETKNIVNNLRKKQAPKAQRTAGRKV